MIKILTFPVTGIRSKVKFEKEFRGQVVHEF